MATPRHLTRAPIVEAIVEFQVDIPADFDVASAASAYRHLGSDYSISEENHRKSFELRLSPEAPAAVAEERKIVGYRFRNEDGQRVVNFTVDGFTFHWLKPYDRWDSMCREAKRLWTVYVDVMKPNAIKRIGVRNINHVSIPLSAKDLCDYLVPGPKVPDGLPQSIQAFISRIEIVDPANDRLGVITQAFRGAADSRTLSFLVDVDAIRTGAFSPNDEQIWSTANQLHDFKNELFFRSVTDLLLEQYE